MEGKVRRMGEKRKVYRFSLRQRAEKRSLGRMCLGEGVWLLHYSDGRS